MELLPTFVPRVEDAAPEDAQKYLVVQASSQHRRKCFRSEMGPAVLSFTKTHPASGYMRNRTPASAPNANTYPYELIGVRNVLST